MASLICGSEQTQHTQERRNKTKTNTGVSFLITDKRPISKKRPVPATKQLNSQNPSENIHKKKKPR